MSAQYDEGFFTDEALLKVFGVLPPIDYPRSPWPEDLPGDFDHIFLRKLGLPCGSDSEREGYALLREAGGWRVHSVSALADYTLERMRASFEQAAVNFVRALLEKAP